MKKPKLIFTASLALAALVLIVIIVRAIDSGSVKPSSYDSFARCLSEQGIKMYGAAWCSHCQAQKAAFGSGWQYVNYVECSTQSDQPQANVCSQAGIEGYPTWIFGDGTKLAGELTFEQLSQKSGCLLAD